MVTQWFINFELPIAISMVSCIPLCGSFLNGFVSPKVFESTGNNFGYPNLIGFIMTLVSCVLVLMTVYLDKYAETKDAETLKQFKKDKAKYGK